jgi:hypothetical protein
MKAGTYFFIMTILFLVGSVVSGSNNMDRIAVAHKYEIVLDRDVFPEFYVTDSIIYHNDRIEFYEKYDSAGMVIYNWNIDKIITK